MIFDVYADSLAEFLVAAPGSSMVFEMYWHFAFLSDFFVEYGLR